MQGTEGGRQWPEVQREGGKDLQEIPRLVVLKGMWRNGQKLGVLPLTKNCEPLSLFTLTSLLLNLETVSSDERSKARQRDNSCHTVLSWVT